MALEIVLLFVVLFLELGTVAILGFLYEKLRKPIDLDLKPVFEQVDQSFAEFFEALEAGFTQKIGELREASHIDMHQAFLNPELQQQLAEIVMGAIVSLVQSEDSQESIGNFIKLHLASAMQNMPVPGLPAQTEEEAQQTQQTVSTITSEVAKGLVDEQLPPFVGGILDRRFEGWRDLLGSDPHAQLQIAQFLAQIGLRERGENLLSGLVQKAASGVGSSPARLSNTKLNKGTVR